MNGTGRTHLRRWIVILQTALLVISACSTAQQPGFTDFTFRKHDRGGWRGSSAGRDAIFGGAVFTIARAAAIVTGSWRPGDSPASVWAGVEADSLEADSTIEIEIYADGSGVLRSQEGWYAVRGFSLSDSVLRFRVDTAGEVRPSELDRSVVERAAAILSSDSNWNHGGDDRHCDADAGRWSIYCAMERACREITGGFHHRRPALQLVRRIVDERSAGRNYRHRLMDYNNDPSTRIGDVRSLFAEALERIPK